MLQFLPYALAAYGGYKGYKASKEAGGSGLQRLLGAGTGAALGYYGGKMIPGVGAAGFGNVASANYTPTFSQLGPMQAFSGSAVGQVTWTFSGSSCSKQDQLHKWLLLLQEELIPAASSATGSSSSMPGGGIFDIFKSQNAKGQMAYDPLKIGVGAGLLSYFGGAYDQQPQDIYTPTYNLAVAELQRQRGGFKYIDPVTGVEKTFDQPYIPEAGRTPQYTLGPYELSKSTFNKGGLAQINKFNEGGINYLPSKVTHDENDSNNYTRAQGYVEDGSGNGDKDEDTMLAQLADGEFVTRADGVLGAGIIAGANPKSMKDMREKGARYFYEQQKRFKRIFDLLEESRNAKAKLN
jgi:hypothetical protein